MSAMAIASNTLSATKSNDPRLLFETLKKKYDIEDTVEEMLKDPELACHFTKTSKKKVTPPPEERQGVYSEHRCDARVWKEKPKSGGLGYDNIQCSSKKVDGCDGLCKKHFKLVRDGKLWLGKVTEDRPEAPMHPTAGLKMWCTDVDGNEVVKEKKQRKTTAKAKKERKPRVKKSDVEVAMNCSVDELLAIIAKKETEEEKEPVESESVPKEPVEEPKEPVEEKKEPVEEKKEPVEEKKEPVEEKKEPVEDDGLETITVDGIEYQHNTEDNTLINCETYEEVGTWNAGTEEIDFYDED